MSGHSKWSTIKRKKGALDAKRGKIFTKLIKEVTVAARMGGGDLSGNPRLRRAVDAARAENMPQDNIDRAIKKGTGELEGVDYEELLYEGVGPAATLFLVQVLTDNRNRTAADVRKIFEKHQGQLGSSGSAAWAFAEKGVIRMAKSEATEEQLFEVAVGAGAEDLQVEGDQWVILTPREQLDEVRDQLERAEKNIKHAELEHLPKTPKRIEIVEDARVLINLADALEDNDDVQKVFSDFDLADEAVAALEAED